MFKILSSLSLVAILLQIHSIHGQPQVVVDINPPEVVEGDTFDACFSLSEIPSLSDFKIRIRPNQKDTSTVDLTLTFPVGADASAATCFTDLTALVDDRDEGAEELMLFKLTTTYNGVTTSNVLAGTLTIHDEQFINEPDSNILPGPQEPEETIEEVPEVPEVPEVEEETEVEESPNPTKQKPGLPHKLSYMCRRFGRCN